MVLSSSVSLCTFRGQNNPKKKVLENIQFEGLYILLFPGQIVANRVKKQRKFDPRILEKKIINKFPTIPPRGEIFPKIVRMNCPPLNRYLRHLIPFQEIQL